MKSTQSEQKSPAAGTKERAEEKGMQGQKSKSMSSENEAAKSGKDMKAEGREGTKDMKAEGREGQKSNMKTQSREGQKSNMNAEQKDTESKSQTTTESQTGQTGRTQTGQIQPGQAGQTTQSQTTTGQAGAAAKLSTEQRSKITTVIREQHVAPVNDVNFSISIGTRVPHERVTLHPIPAEVVSVYPEWRGYEFILVRDQILVVDPRTYEIVAILEA
jgi:Protein of unknown function (DUF1236)